MLLTRANGTESTSKAQQLADRIAQTPLVWQQERIALTVAYGAHGLSTNEDPQQALAAADRAMYQQSRAARAARDRAQAMMSGSRSLSRRAIRSFSASLRFFRR